MQKKIIALAIASAMTVPALAYAEATVYGQARLSIDMVNSGAATNSITNNQLNSQASRVGVKGSEDLGGGLSAVWQMEGDVAMDTGVMGSTTANQVFSRNTFLGLKSGDMGSLLLGRYDTPYKTSTRKLDVFIDTVGDNRAGSSTAVSTGNTGLMGYRHDIRASNSINYISPNMNGMSFAASTIFGAEDAIGAAPQPKKGSALSLAGMYEQGPIYATLAYQTAKAGSTNTGDLAGGGTIMGTTSAFDDKATAFKLGGSYSMDAITVNAVYENLTFTKNAAPGNGDYKNTNLYLAGKFGISSTDAVKAALTLGGATKNPTGPDSKDKATQFVIGYDHAMSKSTTVYALYSKWTFEDPAAPATANPDPSVISVGMNHSF